MLITRISSALVLSSVFLFGLFSPWNIFPVLIVLLLSIAAWEWASLASIDRGYGKAIYVGIVVTLLVLMAVFQDYLLQFVFKFALIVFWFWILLTPLLVKFPATAELFRNKAFAIGISIMILVSSAAGLLWLRMQDNGPWLVLFLLLIVTNADSGAYFTGKKFGKTLLAPQISPGKTFEGFYGGLCVNFVFGLILSLSLSFSPKESFWIMLIVVATSLFSVGGDLLESAIKRSRGVKDSGTILPGHGGILDRIDGLCAATPCFIFGILLSGI